MVQQLSKIALMVTAIVSLAFLAGCQGEEPVPPETTASKGAATESANKWTPEQKAAMQKAISNRRGEGK